jgi:hypothetical protein
MLPELTEFHAPDQKHLEEEYRWMASDAQHELTAEEWCEALSLATLPSWTDS